MRRPCAVATVRRSVHALLHRVAKAHPQGLVYPLTVASKSLSQPRQSAAQRVLSEMRRQSDQLVEQAALVSVERIRTSILWHEMWHSALEEASRLSKIPPTRKVKAEGGGLTHRMNEASKDARGAARTAEHQYCARAGASRASRDRATRASRTLRWTSLRLIWSA